jgi:hypothetical protein
MTAPGFESTKCVVDLDVISGQSVVGREIQELVAAIKKLLHQAR